MYVSIQNYIKFKKTGKYKYLFYSNLSYLIKDLRIRLKRVRSLNKYTLRGLKVTKSRFLKRKGRKSPNL